MNQTQLIIFMIIVQATSALGAYVFGIWGEKAGFKQVLIYSILLMIAGSRVDDFQHHPDRILHHRCAGRIRADGVQSLSRTITSLFAPENKVTEFFAFFAVAGKSSFLHRPDYLWHHRLSHSAVFRGTRHGYAARRAIRSKGRPVLDCAFPGNRPDAAGLGQ